jgi:hypothetical protein
MNDELQTGKAAVASPAAVDLICPRCEESAQAVPPTVWDPDDGPRPDYSHLDGLPLCPVIGPHGYAPAHPIPP